MEINKLYRFESDTLTHMPVIPEDKIEQYEKVIENLENYSFEGLIEFHDSSSLFMYLGSTIRSNSTLWYRFQHKGMIYYIDPLMTSDMKKLHLQVV